MHWACVKGQVGIPLSKSYGIMFCDDATLCPRISATLTAKNHFLSLEQLYRQYPLSQPVCRLNVYRIA